MCTELSDQTPHLILANPGCIGPFSEPDTPILHRGACIPGRHDNVKVGMGEPVTKNKAIDVLGLGHLLQCSGQTVHQSTEGGRFRVGQVA